MIEKTVIRAAKHQSTLKTDHIVLKMRRREKQAREILTIQKILARRQRMKVRRALKASALALNTIQE